MALSTNTLANIRSADLILSYPIRLDEVVEADTPASLDHEDPNSQALLIVRFDDTHAYRAERQGITDWQGTVRMVGPSYSNHDGWLLYANQEIIRVHGAPLNPEPINGHHYRLIGGNHTGYLMRYNDDNHEADRGRRDLPWTIIATDYGGTPPLFGPDGFSNTTITSPYVEVRHGQAATADADAATEEATTESTVGIPTTIPATDRRVHGAAVANDGLVTLNPQLVPGKMYLLIPKQGGLSGELTRIATATPEGFVVSGYIDGYHDFGRARGHELIPAGGEWDHVEMQTTTPERTVDPAGVVLYKRRLHEAKVQYRNWQVALNDLAEEHDWCGEYESAVHRAGVMDRGLRRGDDVPAVPDIDENGDEIEPELPTLRRLYEFDVSFDATFEIDSPSGRIDDAISYAIDVTVSTSAMRFDGSGTVRVGPISAEGTDLEEMEREARDQIDSSMVEDAISNILSEADLNEVTNFSAGDADDVTGDHDLEDYFD